MCWKKVFMMRSPLLQQSCNKYLPFSFSPVTRYFPITPFHIFLSISTCVLKSQIRTVNLVRDSRKRASFTSSTKFSYSLVTLRAYTCNRHDYRSKTLSFIIQTRDPKGIQSDTQSGENPYTRFSRHIRISIKIKEFPSAIQIHSSRATSLG